MQKKHHLLNGNGGFAVWTTHSGGENGMQMGSDYTKRKWL